MVFFRFMAVSSVLALSAPAVAADNAHHWDYSAEHGAAAWGEIADEFKLCKDGLKQSPVNIAAYQIADLPPIEFMYKEAPLSVVNSGHGIHVDIPDGQMVRVGDKVFNLVQFHFHTPSEHYIDGVPFPMAVHFVHKDDAGNLGVIGVMFKVGRANSTIEKIWSHIPKAGESVSPKGVTFSPLDLLPANGDYYAYEGSLTTPPCSEGVAWHVMQQPIEISEEQLRAFQSLFPNNARPVQPLGERVVKGN